MSFNQIKPGKLLEMRVEEQEKVREEEVPSFKSEWVPVGLGMTVG